MKKAVLLSLAAAITLTIGAATAAKAETMQPKVQRVTYTMPLQFLYPSTNQVELQTLFTPIFVKQFIWKPIFIQPANTVMSQQPASKATTVTKQAVIVKPTPTSEQKTAVKQTPVSEQKTVAKPTTVPEQKTVVQPTTVPEQKTVVQPTTVPEQKTVAKPTTVPEQKAASKPTTAPAQKPIAKTTTSSTLSQYEQRVIELTNAERAKHGLPALKVDAELSKVAKAKSQDMYNKNYFDHTSPTYGTPFNMMKQFGVSYRSAGENIAMGQRTPEKVVQDWMNSPGHRANILNNTYTHIGVGYVENKHIWTQMFISK